MNCNGIFGDRGNEWLWIVIIIAIVVIWLNCFCD